jgi:hypothetical protein
MIIANMGGAIEHWLCFQEKIGRSFMMNEDALKYPLADYLVNEGGINVYSIGLEKPHPNFSNRHVDLTMFDSANRNIINNIFELKLAKSATRNQPEKQRIFNDLMRLHLAKIVSADKCYFIITGKTTNFRQDFQNYPNIAGGSRFYQNWFSFQKGQSLTFNVEPERNPDYEPIYSEFLDTYRGSYQDGGTNVLQLPKQITTTCEFVTAFNPTLVPYMAGIWSVV